MKSHQLKVKEANERAIQNSKLSTQQKLDKAMKMEMAGIGLSAREIARLTGKLAQEKADNQEGLRRAKAIAEQKRLEDIHQLNKRKMEGKVVIPSSKVEARKR